MFCCNIDTVVNHWPLTPSHQDPRPIGSRSFQWGVPDLCHRPMKSKDVRRTHVHAYTQTCAHTHQNEGDGKGGKEKEKKEARKEKDSHIRSKIKDTRLHNTQRGREEERTIESETTEEQKA